MKRKLVDRFISALSWVPSERLGLPLIVLFAVAPAAYMLVSDSAGLEVSSNHAAAAPASGLSPDEYDRIAPAADGDLEFSKRFVVMTRELKRVAAAYPGQVGIHLKDLRSGLRWSYHADDLFPSASLIKLPIMVGVFEKIDRGDLSLNSRLKLRRRTRMGGSGSIKWKRDGTRFTVRRLLDKLIHESDNTAMRILIDEVGMGFLQHQFPKMGLVYTEIYPEGLSLRSGRVRYENYTTAREMNMLLEKIYRGQMINGFASELMLELLKGRRHRTRLAKGLPVGWEIAHKTGLLRRACHDAAIIFTPYGDFTLVVLTGRNRSYSGAKDFITRLGKVAYRHYQSDTGLYVRAPGKSSGRTGR